jgi:hypothetical protein
MAFFEAKAAAVASALTLCFLRHRSIRRCPKKTPSPLPHAPLPKMAF